MRFPDDRKHEHKPPHAEVCISFWVERAVSRELQAMANMQSDLRYIKAALT